MVGYKDRFRHDPVYGTDQQHLLTSMWSDHEIGRPETTLTGVSFSRGGYSRIGQRVRAAPAATRSTAPSTGCSTAASSNAATCSARESTVVGYECDGCDVHGRRRAARADPRRRLPAGFEILGTAPASHFDRRTSLRPVPRGRPVGRGVRGVATARRRIARRLRTRAVRPRGDGHLDAPVGGTVVTTGCTDWACGLGVGDDDVEQVTRNLLDRLG